ncbi:AbiH family protein, partial [Lactococcus garvieae]
LQELEILFSEYLEKEFEAWQKNWIKIKADEHKKVNSFYEKLFEKANMIINFNYTASIENIFPNLDAAHIHGRLEEGNIIFGGGFSGSSLLDDTSVKGSTENDKLIRSKKNPKITEQRNKVLKKIDVQKFSSIFVLGHSIIGSDFIFLKPLFENAKKIYVFYYE